MTLQHPKYPLRERIGHPDLFIGGKTAIIQRIFNQLWLENKEIIPFYYEIQDRKTWLPDFAIDYYRKIGMATEIQYIKTNW